MLNGNRNSARVQHDRTLEVTLGLWGRLSQEERRTAEILLRLSLPKCGDHKRCLPYTTLGDAKFFTNLDLGSTYCQVLLRKKDREKIGFACELGLYQWKRMLFGLCNATATFQRLMAQALASVTKKYKKLVTCFLDDVVIATTTLADHIERLDEIFDCMMRAGSKCEILRHSIKYLGRRWIIMA